MPGTFFFCYFKKKNFFLKNCKIFKLPQSHYVNISGLKQLPDLMFNISPTVSFILGLQQAWGGGRGECLKYTYSFLVLCGRPLKI